MAKDYTGYKHGRLTVLNKTDIIGKDGGFLWNCHCECGSFTQKTSHQLSHKHKSCGKCLKNHGDTSIKNLVGQSIGFLKVLTRFVKINSNNKKCGHYVCLCTNCGTVKTYSHSDLKSGKTLSCGCYKSQQLRQKLFKNEVGNVFGKLTVIRISHKINRKYYYECLCECGNSKIISAANLREGTRSCGCEHYARGHKHHRWKENKSNEYRQNTRNSIDYFNWRNNVNLLYKNHCAICNKSNNLVAHHLFNFKDYPELRYNIDNGVLLCEFCHNFFHKIYGKRNNTVFQFYEFLWLNIIFGFYKFKKQIIEDGMSFVRKNIERPI